MDTRGAESFCLRHFANGEYDGTTKGNRCHGFGKILLTGNNEYCGMFEEGRMHGMGTMSWNDGLKYVGPWVNNAATGLGYISWPNGTEYFGNVIKGRREGSGVLFHNSNVYCGEWRNGKRHGFGVQASPAATYTGEWCEGKRHGWGTVLFATGNSYSGSFADDCMEGFGTMTWVTNLKFKKVELPSKDASSREVVKHLRRLVENVGCIRPGPLGPFTPSTLDKGDIFERYTGNFHKNLPHGEGQYEMYFFDGVTRDIPYDTTNQYNGGFQNGLREGFGVQKYADGTLYEGGWHANMKHGKGAIIHADGTHDHVEMELDAPKVGRPPTAKGTTESGGLSVEETLELDDLFPTKAERDAVKELLTRYKSSLKHLYICYCKLWQPIDCGQMTLRMLKDDSHVPPLLWESRVDADVLSSAPDRIPPQSRNDIIVRQMVKRAESLALESAERAVASVQQANDEFVLHTKNSSIEVAESELPDLDQMEDFLSAGKVNESNSANRSRGRRPATPLGDGQLRTSIGPPPAPPLIPQRSEKQTHLSKYQFQCLLRDALVIGGDLTATLVNDIIAVSMGFHTADPEEDLDDETPHHTRLKPPPPFRRADTFSDEITFRTFVECLVRIAEVKFSATQPFAVPNSLQKWSLGDRLEFLLENFIEPLRVALCEAELCGDLAQFDWPVFVEEITGDHTVDELRRAAQRAILREQARIAAQQKQLSSSSTSKGKVEEEPDEDPQPLPPLLQESIDGTVTDRTIVNLCPSTSIEIITVEATSSLAPNPRYHQLYLLREGNGETVHFCGFAPSYQPAVSSLDSDDLLVVLPTKLHLSSTAVIPLVERHLRFLYDVFLDCCFEADNALGGDGPRANLGKFMKLLLRNGLLEDTEPKDAQPPVPTTEEPASIKEDGEAEDEQHEEEQEAAAVHVASPDAFLRICLEIEFSAPVEGKQEYCCPGLYLESHNCIAASVFDDPQMRALMKVSPELSEAVSMAIKRSKNTDERRKVFAVPTFKIGIERWWLIAANFNMTFQSFVEVILRLTIFLYGTTNIAESLKTCLERLEEKDIVKGDDVLAAAAFPPPPKVDKPLPVRRRNAQQVVDDKNKKKPAPSKK